MARQVTPEQRAGHATVTRGMDKSMIPFAVQITSARTDAQRTVRAPRLCRSCTQPREGTDPFCVACQRKAA